MKIVFLGTSDFSETVFKKLNSVYPLTAVVTGPDKQSGRGYELKLGALKVAANEAGVKVLQYKSVSREGIDDLKVLEPDLIVTAAFGQILSDEFLSIPKFGVINVHASLLPRYRGASPIQAAVLNGDDATGITVMRTVKAVDAGDILLKKQIEISHTDTAGSLFERLACLGGEMIVEAVKLIESGKAVYTPQNDAEASYCRMIKKVDGLINFDKTYKELDCFVRAMTPWPCSFTHIGEKTVKVFSVTPALGEPSATVGQVLTANSNSGLTVACKDGAVRLATLQPENKSKMTDVAFLNGNPVKVGTVLK